jgi:hypothetical protein
MNWRNARLRPDGPDRLPGGIGANLDRVPRRRRMGLGYGRLGAGEGHALDELPGGAEGMIALPRTGKASLKFDWPFTIPEGI